MKYYFFKSEHDISSYFAIKVDVIDLENNCTVTVFNYSPDSQDLINGDEIPEYETYSLDKIFEIDIWPKYYFPKFTTDVMQWYHDFDGLGKYDYIQAVADAMKYALKFGIEKGNIILR